MRTLILIIALIPVAVFAQNVNIKDIDTDSESTTIEISKGKKKIEEAVKCTANWEITEGSADINGEGANMMGEAKKNYKKACDDWKKEFRADNKENKIININCGTMNCNSEAMEKTCTSRASYKIKTRID